MILTPVERLSSRRRPRCRPTPPDARHGAAQRLPAAGADQPAAGLLQARSRADEAAPRRASTSTRSCDSWSPPPRRWPSSAAFTSKSTAIPSCHFRRRRGQDRHDHQQPALERHQVHAAGGTIARDPPPGRSRVGLGHRHRHRHRRRAVRADLRAVRAGRRFVVARVQRHRSGAVAGQGTGRVARRPDPRRERNRARARGSGSTCRCGRCRETQAGSPPAPWPRLAKRFADLDTFVEKPQAPAAYEPPANRFAAHDAGRRRHGRNAGPAGRNPQRRLPRGLRPRRPGGTRSRPPRTPRPDHLRRHDAARRRPGILPPDQGRPGRRPTSPS